ncbi:MAG: endonuclease VII domain-containing protein [Actinomycetota bacterium]|nr:endonuclease VII domain-containing protein [Actinomycetota bacterium]
MEKRCRICGEGKPEVEFYRANGMRDGRRSECKPCFKEQARLRYDSATAVERARQWALNNPERVAAYRAEYRNRPERKRAMRDLYYRRTYGLTADQVDEMLERQSGGCAVCGVLPDTLGKLHLDHCHGTGAIRGLLCQSCNQAIGHLRDDPELLRKAAEYLERSAS